MYESKYSKYLIKNTNRFATRDEIIAFCKPNKKNNKTKYAGVPIFYDGRCLYVDNSDSHYMTIGGTASKKTRTSAINMVLSSIYAGENNIITDPKGELYRKTAGVAKTLGYNLKVFNLRSPKKSNGWNPMYLPYMMDVTGKKEEAEEMLNDFIESLTAPIKENTKDEYWANRVNSYEYGIARLLMDSITKEYFNIATLMTISQKKNKNALEEIIRNCDGKQPFFDSIESFINMSAEKTQDCLYDTMHEAFGPYSKKTALLNILCENDIDFADLVDENKKTIVYIIYPDEKKTMAFLVNLFLTQCYLYLKLYVEENNLPNLKKRVNFICEEFGNLPKIEGFPKRISMARGFNIRYFLFLQSSSQLEKIYKEDAQTIKSNCDWIVYPSKERAFLKEASEFCGEVRDFRNSIKPLVSIDRIQHLKKYLDGAEALVIKNGYYPFIVKMPDYEYIDIFDIGDEVTLEEKKRDFYNNVLTMDEWLRGIREEKFNFPFPKAEREFDRRTAFFSNTKSPKSHMHKKDNIDASSDDDAMKRLEKKFDELFGPIDDN